MFHWVGGVSILAQNQLADTIAEALAIIARPGFVVTELSSGTSKRMGVVLRSASARAVFRKSDLTDPDGTSIWNSTCFNPYQPPNLSSRGGLRLPGHVRRFSTLAPPEVRVAAEEATSISLEVSQVRAIGSSVDQVTQTFMGSAAVRAWLTSGSPMVTTRSSRPATGQARISP